MRFGNLNDAAKLISVEPAYVFFHLCYFLMEIANTNLYLQKSCRHDTTAEPDLNTPCDDERTGVEFTATVNAWYRSVAMYAMIAATTLVTAWSDLAGKRRKICIVFPAAVQTLQAFVSCVQAYHWQWSPMCTVWTELICQLVSGGFVMHSVMAGIYILDTTTVQSRTTRFAILKMLQTLTEPVSTGFSGFLMRNAGFFNTYLICLTLSALGLICGVVVIKEISVPVEKKVSVFRIFDLRGLKSSFDLVFKEKKGKARLCVLTLLTMNVLLYFTYQGERSVFYLYFRYRFKWDEVMYSIYLGYKLTGVVLGTLFCSIVLSKILKIHDGIIGTFASFWDTLAAVCYIFATQTWQLYLIPLLDVFHGMALAVCDSFQSKFFESHEMGQLFSVHMFFNLLIPICIPAYNLLFKSTMDVFPASFFLISVPINIIICILYSITYYLVKTDTTSKS